MGVAEARSRTAMNAGLFSVEDLYVRFSNGTERTYQRLKMRSPRSVMIIPITPRNTLLLIREFAAGIDDYVIKFPTGTVENDETVEEAAARELREETGWILRTISVVKQIYADPGYCDQKTYVAIARDLVWGQMEGDEPEVPRLHECDTRDWQTLQDSLIDARSLATLAILDGSLEVAVR